MDAAGTNKSITRQELQTYNAGTLTNDVKVLDLSATWNDAGVTFTGLKFNVTDTASNAASLLLDLQVGGTSLYRWTKGGKTIAPDITSGYNRGYFFSNAGSADLGFARRTSNVVDFFISSTAYYSFNTSLSFSLHPNSALAWATSNAAGDINLALYRDADNTLAQRRTTNAQTFRLYNTWTDASNYERLGINWGSNIVSIKPEAAGTGTVRVLHISGLPTSNPGPGILWNDSNTVKVGT
jgi:hypothetical protein